MPNFIFDITPATDRTLSLEGQLVDPGTNFPGFLFSFTALIKDGSAQSGQVYVQAGTYAATLAEDSKRATVLNGYVYSGFSPTWIGKLPIEQSEGIWVSARSDGATVTIRFVGKVLKNDP